MTNLISMTDYVIKEWNDSFSNNEVMVSKCVDYANFLKRPLNIGMFVPCVNNEPFNYSIHGNIEDYGKAKEQVLFEGFGIIAYGSIAYQLEIGEHSIMYDLRRKEFISGTHLVLSTIEDLVYLGLTLTNNN